MSRIKYNIFLLIIILFGLGSGVYIYKTHYAHQKVEEHTEIKLWYVETDSMNIGFSETAEKYNAIESKQRKNITVSVQGFESYSEMDKALEEAGAGGLPDMIACDADYSAVYREKSYTIRPSVYFDEWNLEGFNEDFLKCATVNGKLIAIPYAADIELMLVNTDFVTDAGAISSLEDLCERAKNYYKSNSSSMFSIGDYAEFFRTVMAQLGDEFDAVSPRDTESENCKYIYKLLAQSAFDRGMTSCDDPVASVISGEIPCAIVSSSTIMENASKIKNNIRVYPCPVVENGEQVFEPEVRCICICKTDTNRENASAEFIRWFISEEVNREFVADSGFIPVTVSMKSIESKRPVYGDIKKVVADLDSTAKHANYSPNSEYVKNYEGFIYVMKLVMESLS